MRGLAGRRTARNARNDTERSKKTRTKVCREENRRVISDAADQRQERRPAGESGTHFLPSRRTSGRSIIGRRSAIFSSRFSEAGPVAESVQSATDLANRERRRHRDCGLTAKLS